MFPADLLLLFKVIDYLHLNNWLRQICNFVLRRIFKRKTFTLIIMHLIVPHKLQSRKVAREECTFAISYNICFGSVIRNFECKHVITLDRKIADFKLRRMMIC